MGSINGDCEVMTLLEKEILINLMDVVSSFWGIIYYIILLYLVCLSINYTAGVLVAIKKKQWKTYDVFAGVWRIVGSVCAIMVGISLDLLIEFLNVYFHSINIQIGNIPVFCCLVLAWCIVSELAGIIKSARELGYSAPSFLESAVRRLGEEIDDISDAAQDANADSTEDEKGNIPM